MQTKVGEDVERLVERAQRGDKAALSELFRRHASLVTALVYRMLGRSPDLEDVVQEVFLQVHRSLNDFRGQAKFSTWLHRVAINVVLMHRRRAKSRPTLAAEDSGGEAPDSTWTPDKDLARQRRIDAFHRLLDKLSDKKREVFVLHEIEGMSPAEIATVTRCPVLTVRTRLFYARKELGELMREEPALASLVGEIDFSRSSGRPQSEGPVSLTDAPSLAPSSLETPSLETPSLETPSLETPSLETPSLETPSLETPSLETPSLAPDSLVQSRETLAILDEGEEER